MVRRALSMLLKFFSVCAFLLAAPAAFALQMKPELAIPIPNVQLSNLVVTNVAGQERVLDIPWLGEYVTGVYSYAVVIAGILAGVMFVVGGFQYLTAGGDTSRVSQAKDRIKDAMIGLFLTLGAFVILTTISPQLTSFEALRIKSVKRIGFTLPDDIPEETSGSTDETRTPMARTTSANFKSPITFNAANIARLNQAADDLAEATRDAPYGQQKIVGSGGDRTLATQARLFKARCIAGTFTGEGSSRTYTAIEEGRTRCTIPTCNPYRGSDFVTNPVAGHTGRWLRITPDERSQWFPNFCPHTSGKAVDISCSNSRDAIHGIHVPCHKILEQVMQRNGFCRLQSEPWHFELPALSRPCPTSWTPGTHTEAGVTHNYGDCEGWYDSYNTTVTSDSARCSRR